MPLPLSYYFLVSLALDAWNHNVENIKSLRLYHYYHWKQILRVIDEILGIIQIMPSFIITESIENTLKFFLIITVFSLEN